MSLDHSLHGLYNHVEETDEDGNLIITSHCGNLRFPASKYLTIRELEKRTKYSMYPYYRSFYIWLNYEDRYVIVTELMERLSIFSYVSLDDLVAGSFREGWALKDEESENMLESLSAAYHINQDFRSKYLERRQESLGEDDTEDDTCDESHSTDDVNEEETKENSSQPTRETIVDTFAEVGKMILDEAQKKGAKPQNVDLSFDNLANAAKKVAESLTGTQLTQPKQNAMNVGQSHNPMDLGQLFSAATDILGTMSSPSRPSASQQPTTQTNTNRNNVRNTSPFSGFMDVLNSMGSKSSGKSEESMSPEPKVTMKVTKLID